MIWPQGRLQRMRVDLKTMHIAVSEIQLNPVTAIYQIIRALLRQNEYVRELKLKISLVMAAGSFLSRSALSSSSGAFLIVI